jgi:membrane peptidoglycan carboxypeptidase
VPGRGAGRPPSGGDWRARSAGYGGAAGQVGGVGYDRQAGNGQRGDYGGQNGAQRSRAQRDGYGAQAGEGRRLSPDSARGYGGNERQAGDGRRASSGQAGSGRSDGSGRPAGNGRQGGFEGQAGNGRQGGFEGQAGNGRQGGFDRGDRPRPVSAAGQRGGRDPRSWPDRGGNGRVADDLRGRLGMRAGSGPGQPQALGAGVPARSRPGPAGYGGPAGPVGPAGYGGTPGYGNGTGHGTLQRDRTGSAPDQWPAGNGHRARGHRRNGGNGHGGGWDDGPDGGDGSGGGKGWRKWLLRGRWWRHWTWRKALGVVAGCCLAAVLLVAGVIYYFYSHTQIPSDVLETALTQPSTVYFSNGSKVALFSTGINRQLLDPQQIPADLKNAVIAAEDRGFYTEGGISITGIMRSGYEDIFGSGGLQGGSTITEQFVKNYYANIGSSRTMSVKVKEILVAMKLSREKSKTWILTNYLNTIPFGDEAYGAQAAAETYFGIPAIKLDIAQAAMLAALVNQPGNFSAVPGSPGYAPLVSRWHYVLGNMLRDGVITQSQLAAQKFPKIVHKQYNNAWTGYRGYIMSLVEGELEARYGLTPQQIYTGGYKIYTTISKNMMNGLYRAVHENEQLMKQGGEALPSYAHVGAALEQPGTGAILAIYGGPNYTARHCRKLHCQYDMALAAQQVGSSFKPYVLATAVKQGMNAKTSILNGYAPICIPPDWTLADRMMLSTRGTNCDTPDGFKLFNETAENFGPLTVPNAIAQSSDPGFEDLIHRVGVQNTIQMAQSLGVSSYDIAGLESLFGPKGAFAGSVQMALGEGNLTAVDQANTFADFADGGYAYTPHVIAKIVKPNGIIPIKVTESQPLTPQQAADIDYDLTFVNSAPNGTATPYASWDRPVISKTGTLGAGTISSDAWLVGAIPQASLSVGMFTNTKSQSLDGIGGISGGFGGTWPARIWKTFMSTQFATTPVRDFAPPDFTGFSKWLQVNQVPQRRKRLNPSPNPQPSCPGFSRRRACRSPNPQPSCPGFGAGPCPSPTPTPIPTPNPTPTPTPTPSCTAGPGNPCQPPPAGLGTTAAVILRSQAQGKLTVLALARIRASPVLLT